MLEFTDVLGIKFTIPAAAILYVASRHDGAVTSGTTIWVQAAVPRSIELAAIHAYESVVAAWKAALGSNSVPEPTEMREASLDYQKTTDKGQWPFEHFEAGVNWLAERLKITDG